MRAASCLFLLLVSGCGQDGADRDGVDGDGGAGDPLPDLVMDQDTLATDLSIETKTFADAACELSGIDLCVGGPGERRLLRFSVASANVGTADLVLGDPARRPDDFEFSTCHAHHHLVDYAAYELVDGDGEPVAAGHKQSFCLMDRIRMAGDGVAEQPRYTCNNQGLQRGWADLYDASVPCQWIDITDVRDGDYELVVSVNASGLIEELDHDNNEVRTPVRVGSPELASPAEPCDPALDPDALAGSTRECGWTRATDLECVPGSYLTVGCGAEVESCTGQPVLRICDAAGDNCTIGSSLASAMPGPGGQCPAVEGVECPASGRVTAYAGSLVVGDEYSCAVTIGTL